MRLPKGTPVARTWVSVNAPASSANLGPGFDVFALALRGPVDNVRIDTEPARVLKVEVRSPGSALPQDARRNSAGAVVAAMAKDLRIKGRLVVTVKKGVPVGVGLGSSAASSAAAAMAMNALFSLWLSPERLVRYAGVGERAASGTAHLDNVTASILGGFVLAPSPKGPPLRFDSPLGMAVCLVTPLVKLPPGKTAYARSLLPRRVPISSMVANVAAASAMVAAFARGDAAAVGAAMDDVVVEPARSKMIPGYKAARKAALDSGALGFCISGAGPTVLALVDRAKEKPAGVVAAVERAFSRSGVKAYGYVTEVGEGARVNGLSG